MRTPYRTRLKNVPRRVGPDLFFPLSLPSEDVESQTYMVLAKFGSSIGAVDMSVNSERC